ncbi:winged helix-turn-helix transcriptional regulator [Candidatus Woesearchaeota archaeon]|nr:winged helix-turn-helix transcriptional regulator [Candidatus Woesearchaeota archaeon]
MSENELKAVLAILKHPEQRYNAHTLSKELGISAMGTLKILKRLEKEGIVRGENIANARFYRVRIKEVYAREYAKFALLREAANAPPQVKRWIQELKKVRYADAAILFGSVLRKKDPKDIDVLFVTDQKRFKKLQEEIKELNALTPKAIHPIFQSYKDLVNNIKKKDVVILDAIKGIVAFGADILLEAYYESHQE